MLDWLFDCLFGLVVQNPKSTKNQQSKKKKCCYLQCFSNLPLVGIYKRLWLYEFKGLGFYKGLGFMELIRVEFIGGFMSARVYKGLVIVYSVLRL